MSNNYVDIMIQSLKKKDQVLKEIIEQNKRQREVLENVNGDSDEFDETVSAKAKLIEQLEQLDSGFQKLFDRVKEELDANKDNYADEIKEIQKYIRYVTDESIEIQAQEARNKDLMTSKFTQVKGQIKNMRVGAEVASQYYKNMSKVNLIDPQFMDNKH